LYVQIKTSGNWGQPCPVNVLRFLKDMTETTPEIRRLGYARVSTYTALPPVQ